MRVLVWYGGRIFILVFRKDAGIERSSLSRTPLAICYSQTIFLQGSKRNRTKYLKTSLAQLSAHSAWCDCIATVSHLNLIDSVEIGAV